MSPISWARPDVSLPTTELEIEWQYDVGGEVNSSPAVVDGTVYIGSSDRHVYALKANSGDKLWRFETTGSVHSSPAVVNGGIYVGSGFLDAEDTHVYAIGANTGNERWGFETGDSVPSSPAVTNGIVYVGRSDNQISELPERYFVICADTHGHKYVKISGTLIRLSAQRAASRRSSCISNRRFPSS